jgi:hypothetical protein
LNQTLPLEVYDAFVDSGDFCTNSSLQYAELLEAGIDVMIYSSTVDPLLGPPTTEGGIDGIMADAKRISPSSASGFAGKMAAAYYSSNKTLWATSDSDQTAGYAKCATIENTNKNKRQTKEQGKEQGKEQRFCYVVVRNAGHMTPAFQPRSALEMLGRFLEDLTFDGKSGETPNLPKCAQCGGSGPFAGAALPACHSNQNVPEKVSKTSATLSSGDKTICKKDVDCPSSYYESHHRHFEMPPYHCAPCDNVAKNCCNSDADCEGSYCMDGPAHKAPFTCHGN